MAMHLTHLIIDDFFDQPHAVREAALRMEYPPRPEGAQYPGRNANGKLPMDGIERLISQIVHEPVVPMVKDSSHAMPRLAMAGDEGRNNVHYDHCHWSAIICLSLDEHVVGGTQFKKHIPTGYDRCPVFPGEPEALGYSSVPQAVNAMRSKDNFKEEEWETTFEIPFKFNRMLLFRGYLWHDAGVSFGDKPENGRLILPLFFDTPSANV
ncbi:hypothetical protein HK107_10305 [Parvularcula sp. ZS-1/3]|uniref:Phytanoyl-CoA dioxygenase n=1 Tax=Parvularcula mediterranea TaxID=2732508 RepID=A0A7Y3RMA7_9PROT|nr:DUF6445 family protein [Parvularcula mediterranea]NNU16713.1 hypothetical protein [Parvularcula mediterranea]